MEIRQKIINYIDQNRVSTSEVADCLEKTGALEGLSPLNPRHFAVGEVHYLYAIQDSNWTIHEEFAQNPVTDHIVLLDAIDVHGRALAGDIITKYFLMYNKNRGIICTGKMRDAHTLIKENYPIWCAGVTPIGCFNTPVDKTTYQSEIEQRRNFFRDTIAVCDDSGVVIIPKQQITNEFYDKLQAIEEQEDIWYDCIDRRKWSTYKTICQKDYLK